MVIALSVSGVPEGGGEDILFGAGEADGGGVGGTNPTSASDKPPPVLGAGDGDVKPTSSSVMAVPTDH